MLVVRAFPIRVAGDSRHLPQEIDWEVVGWEGGWQSPPIEYTSVSKKVRRVGRFSAEIVRAAIEINAPSHLVLNHLDQVDRNAKAARPITDRTREFIKFVEAQIDRSLDYIGVGPADTIRQRRDEKAFLRAAN